MVRLLLPIVIGLTALLSIEFSSVMPWLLVQPTGIVLTGLGLLSGVVLLLSKSVANQADRVAELIGQPYGTLVLIAAVMTIELAWWPAPCSLGRATQPWPGIQCSQW